MNIKNERRKCIRLHGQALVEFALFLVMLLLIMSVLIDSVRIITLHRAMSEAAREGAIYGSVVPNSVRISERTKRAESILTLSNDEINIDFNTSACANGTNTVTVTVFKKIKLVTPITSFIPGLSGELNLSAAHQALIIAPPCS